jgi:predicted PolB exonuclease-like 3'-5' exonuclease
MREKGKFNRMNILVFDIETIPDIDNCKKIYGLQDFSGSSNELVEKIREIRKEQTNGSDFMRHHLHQIVAISVVLQTRDKLKIFSVGDENASEKEIIQRFFDGIEKYSPALVSWNGSGFDLPVLHYRMLLHGISAPRYWEIGDEDNNFKWNNYLNRYHYRHMDLMDILACYQSRACASLDDISIMLGSPGKFGIDGSKVWEKYSAGKIREIREYCETDVLNTYLIYLRFELIRGKLSESDYIHKIEQVKLLLNEEANSHQHLKEFLALWNHCL